MKGLVNTIETAVGTVLLITIVTLVFGSQLPQDDASSYNNVQRQLDHMQEMGQLNEYVSERDASGLENKIVPLPVRVNVSIIYENVTRDSGSSSDFNSSFNFQSEHQQPFLFLWSEGESFSVDLNNKDVYSGSERFKIADISSETEVGNNTLEFENTAGQRVSYAVSRRSVHGNPVSGKDDVSIVRRIVVPENQDDLAEVVIYLW